MSKQDAQNAALRLAAAKLQNVDLARRCPHLGLPAPVDGKLVLPLFGAETTLELASFTAITGGKPTKPNDLILLLHYLLCDVPLAATDELISFRDFPGGQFYLEPFLSRTAKPLLQRIGNDLDRLRANLQRFRATELPLGDLGARVPIVGNLFLTLVYRRGDDELPPTLDVLFSANTKRAFNADDASCAASRVCLSLL